MNFEVGTSSDDELVPATNLKNSRADVRVDFVRKVYGILGFQLLLTVGIAAPVRMMVTPAQMMQHHGLVTVIIFTPVIMLVAVQCCCHQTLKQHPQNLCFLLLFTVFEALTVGLVTVMYTTPSVLMVACVTAGLVLSLSVYAACTKQDFTGCGPYLFAFCMALMWFSFILCLFSWFTPIPGPMHKLYSGLAVIMFAFYIVYDTQMIIGEAPIFGIGAHHRGMGYSIDDYVFAALNLYIDIIGLFMNLLALFGDRR